jgi:thiamine phosphate synthase YjbQ (UPF0047 family)
MHITASVFINDDESGLHRDFERWLEKLAPEKPTRSTITTAPARTTAMPTSSAPSWPRSRRGRHRRRPDLGPWERIFYGEFDGLRRKRVLIKIIGE